MILPIQFYLRFKVSLLRIFDSENLRFPFSTKDTYMERSCRNYILHRKKNYNKSNILSLATQYSLNLFVKRYNVIVNKHCWIIKHPCRFRINLYRSRKVLPCKTRNKKIVENNSMGKHLCRQHLQRQCSGFSWVVLKSVSNWLYTSTAIDSLLHSRF